SERSRRAVAPREQVVGADLTPRNAALQIAERRINELLPAQGAHDPALGSSRCRIGKYLELIAAIGALDRRASLRDQGIVELVFRAAAATPDIHLLFRRSSGPAILVETIEKAGSLHAGARPSSGSCRDLARFSVIAACTAMLPQRPHNTVRFELPLPTSSC